MGQNLVLTPGGYRDASLVHRIEPGHALQMNQGRARVLHLETNRVIEIPPPAVLPGQVPGFGTGWITYGWWTNDTGTPITSFRTRWTVPPAPTAQDAQTIFLFNGIDPANAGDAILQPVLQWGPSHAGGGNYWSVASWYVLGNGQAFFTPLVRVNEGDDLVGVMKLTGQGGGSFNYTAEFEGIAGTNLPVQNVAELVWLNETLEAYGIQSCADYPNTAFTGMRSIEIQTAQGNPPITWTPGDAVTDCGQHTIVVSNSTADGEVDLYYRQAQRAPDFSRFAEYIDILFGVIHGEGGIGIVNGHIIKVPPRSPDWAMFTAIAQGVKKALQGFGVRDFTRGGQSSETHQLALRLIQQGLKDALSAVEREIR